MDDKIDGLYNLIAIKIPIVEDPVAHITFLFVIMAPDHLLPFFVMR